MKVYICQVCGHIEFGSAPEKCPVCWAAKFSQNDSVFEESMEKSREGAVKHIPKVSIVDKCGLIPEESCTDIIVRIGETLHPMKEEHFIQWIDCYLDDKYVSRLYLTPDMNPAVIFHLKSSGSKITIVENCNIHGYWKADAAL
jgi:superoxide reductase